MVVIVVQTWLQIGLANVVGRMSGNYRPINLGHRRVSPSVLCLIEFVGLWLLVGVIVIGGCVVGSWFFRPSIVLFIRVRLMFA